MSALSCAHTGCHCVIPCVWVILVIVVITKTAGLLLVRQAIKVGDCFLAAGDISLNGKTRIVKDAISMLLLKVGHALCNAANRALRATLCWHASEVYCAGAKAVWLSLAEILNTC